MSVTSGRLRALAAVALVAGLTLGTAACSKDPAKTSGGPVTIKVQTFGNFGYTKAVEDWNASHTDIKIDHQKMGELRDFAPQLAQWLAAGSGAGDVVGLEEGQLLGYIKNHQGFLNLFDVGGRELENTYVTWKWERGLADDGKFLLGLGTDVGGTALCYRRDLFEKAGLPTDRDKVAELIPSWDAYVSVGKQFAAKNTGATWLDSATSIMQPYIMQQGSSWFFDSGDKFVGDTNPIVRKAWDLGLQMAADGLTGKLARWSPDWDAAFKNFAFATVFCPAWMTEGVIKPRAGDSNSGKWDVAKMPGGVGNWGGSYLAVPKQTAHPKEAYQVTRYLTSKEGHLAAYKEAATMPSSVAALDDAAFANSTSAYFNNAPIGTMMVPTQLGVIPLYLLMVKLHWTGTLQAVIAPFLVSGFGVFMMRQYAASAVPDELIEAARVDGCSTWRIYWNIVLPALRPAASVLALLTFMQTWNEFLWPFIVLNPNTPTVQLSLKILAAGYYNTDYAQVFAGTAISIIPLLVVFVVFGRQIISGIMEGSVKA